MKSVPRYTFRISGTLCYMQLLTHFTWLRILSSAVLAVSFEGPQGFSQEAARWTNYADEFWKKRKYNFQLKFMILSSVYGRVQRNKFLAFLLILNYFYIIFTTFCHQN
jgi:hypothetical protein